MPPVVANALKHAMPIYPWFRSSRPYVHVGVGVVSKPSWPLCSPQARVKGRLLQVSRQAHRGPAHDRVCGGASTRTSVEAATLAEALRGLQPLQTLLTLFVRNTPWLHAVMRMVQTQG